MTVRIAAVASFLMLAVNASFAAPVTYSFSTGVNAFGGPSVAGAPFLTPSLLNGGAFGTFTYDSSALLGVVSADGSFIYRGSAPQSATGFVTSTSNLAGTVGGLNFSDLAGSTNVGNDTFLPTGGSQKVDFFQLAFEPSLTSTFPHNLSGFSLDGFTLVNVRMFWIEGQAVPETIGDFLTNQDLPGVLPSFHGRMAFDFVQTTNPSGPMSFVFFDGLSVHSVASIPEPQTYALLVAGIVLLWLGAPRRKSPSAA